MSYRFDPELAPFLDLLPGMTLDDVPAARAAMLKLVSMAPEVDASGVAFDDREVPGPKGDGPVSVRVYRPRREAPAEGWPAVLYIHGGGFVVGNVEAEHGGCVRICADVGAVVVSVEYRLAPEHPYPAGVEDCYAALIWMHGAVGDLGVDASRIAVMGSSAGGGLSAAVALLARDRGEPPLCFQFLGIPELDDRLETPSMRAFTDTPVWHRASAVLSWRYYLGPLAGQAEIPIYAAPARATDLSGLPPAYVSTCEYDPLRDEGIDYAARLMRAGVSTELHCFPGTWHGSSMIVGAAVSQRAGRETMAVLSKALAAPAPVAS